MFSHAECIIRPVVCVSALTWFIRYIFIEIYSSEVIIIKTKDIGVFNRIWLSCLGPLVLLLPKISKINWLYKLLAMNVADECYSRSSSSTLNLIPEPQVTKPELLQENKNDIVGNKTLQ